MQGKKQRNIVMSAHSEVKYFLKAIEIGVDGFLIKPINRKKLFSILLFQKQMRWCIINIVEDQFNTYVELGVAPSITESNESALMQ